MHIINSSGNVLQSNTLIKSPSPAKLTSQQAESLQAAKDNPEAREQSSSEQRISNTRNIRAATYEHLSKTTNTLQTDFNSMRESMGNLSRFATSNSEFESTYRTRVDQMEDSQSLSQGRLMSVTVRTKEGDEIEFQIDRSIGVESNKEGMMRVAETRVSFSVTGDLSDEEREALGELADKLGFLADSYLGDRKTSMNNLLDLDQDVLSGFNFDIKGLESSNFSAEYAVDEQAGTRSLSANLDDYTYELSSNIEGFFLDETLSDNEQYRAIRDLITDTARAYKAGDQGIGKVSSEIASFFLDGLDALFLNVEPEDESADGDESPSTHGVSRALERNLGQEDGVLDSFASGLPDFSAEFNTPLLRPNENAQGEVSTMGLEVSQSTDIQHAKEGARDVDVIKQSLEYQSRMSQHVDVEPPGIENGADSYVYRTDKESGSLTRALTVLDGITPVSVEEKSEHQHERTEKTVKDGKTISHESEDLSRDSENYEVKKLLPPLPEEEDLTEREMLKYLSIDGVQNRTLGG